MNAAHSPKPAQPQTIGFIGLGLMGNPMVQRLNGAGFELVVFDQDSARLDAASRSGARAASSPGEVVRESAIVCLCVNGLAQVRDVVSAVGSAWHDKSLVLDFSTCDATAVRALAADLNAEHGLGWVDAPMSGGPPAAQSGSLTIMVGGQSTHIDTVRPILDELAGNWTHLGDVGSGQVAKMINQMLVLNAFCTVAEALRLAEKSGLDAKQIPKALAGGYADSAILQHHWELMRQRQFDPPTGYAWVNLKDLDMVGALSRELQTPIPMTAQATNIYRSLIARGDGELDTLAIYKLYDDPPA